MTLKEAAALVPEKLNGKQAIAGRETEHFYIFTGFAYKYDDPLALGANANDFAVEKSSGKSGYVTSPMELIFDPSKRIVGWDQFDHDEPEYENVRDLQSDLKELFIG